MIMYSCFILCLFVLVSSIQCVTIPGTTSIGDGKTVSHENVPISLYFLSQQPNLLRIIFKLPNTEKLVNVVDLGENNINISGKVGHLFSIENIIQDVKLYQLLTRSEGETIWTSGSFDNDIKNWRWSSTNEVFKYSNPSFTPSNPSSNTTHVAFKVNDPLSFSWEIVEGSNENRFVCEVHHANDTPVPCDNKNDLVMALDGSGSVNANDFTLGKQFVAKLAKAFKPPSRISFIVFSSDSRIIFDLNNNLSEKEIETKILSAVQPSSGTHTHLAIQQAIDQLRQTVESTPRKLVVFTDGKSNFDKLTASQAEEGHKAQIKTYSVGIGANYNFEELMTITHNNPSQVYTSKTFDTLIQIIAPLSLAICNE